MVGQVRRSTTLRILLYDLILCVNDYKIKTMPLFSQTRLRLSGWDLILELNSKKEESIPQSFDGGVGSEVHHPTDSKLIHSSWI